jgi:hypothetical protein
MQILAQARVWYLYRMVYYLEKASREAVSEEAAAGIFSNVRV